MGTIVPMRLYLAKSDVASGCLLYLESQRPFARGKKKMLGEQKLNLAMAETIFRGPGRIFAIWRFVKQVISA